MFMENKLLFTGKHIEDSIKHLGYRINHIFHDIPKEDIVVIGILSGCFRFVSSLLKHLDFDFELKWISCKTYNKNKKTNKANIKFVDFKKGDLDNKYIILLDDIIDTGHTVKELLKKINKNHSPHYIYKAFMLKRNNNISHSLYDDYCLRIDSNDYVVGFGLDNNGFNRNKNNLEIINAIH